MGCRQRTPATPWWPMSPAPSSLYSPYSTVLESTVLYVKPTAVRGNREGRRSSLSKGPKRFHPLEVLATLAWVTLTAVAKMILEHGSRPGEFTASYSLEQMERDAADSFVTQ